MIGKKTTATLSVVLLIIFALMAGATILKSNVSLGTSQGYAYINENSINITGSTVEKVNVNGTYNYVIVKEIESSTQTININFTLYSSSSTVYAFNFANYTVNGMNYNITQFNSVYNFEKITGFKNGTQISLKLYVNSSTFNMLPYYNQSNPSATSFVDKILLLTGTDGFAYFYFIIVKIP
ncbi:hypothetical protein [Caldiplasma sukawensis]